MSSSSKGLVGHYRVPTEYEHEITMVGRLGKER